MHQGGFHYKDYKDARTPKHKLLSSPVVIVTKLLYLIGDGGLGS
jgi:hypothetical protein